ncbi:MAG: hypothetical protein RIQ47_1198 [Bacteroidota bacterium]|jgi:hypothetical protein
MPAEKSIHIISFDVPFPPDYGGVIDVFYKIKALYELGVSVHLHCFEYGRAPREELNPYCASVNYYPRQTNKSLLFNTLPYIVLSRSSDDLRKRLLQDDYPILMEGIHCTHLLNDPAFFGRRCFVRSHNVEHDYYHNLAKVERNIFKRYYFYNETGKLRKYEPVLKRAKAIAAISPEDTHYFNSTYGNAFYLPAFHPFEQVIFTTETNDFAFYHGNLAVGENNEAALYLIEKVFAGLPYKLIVAGAKPSAALRRAVASHANVSLMDRLSPEEIHRHIATARVNVLPTFQATGIKLKLLASLFLGKHVLVNSPMVDKTGLEDLCTIADSPEEFRSQLKIIFEEKDFPERNVTERKSILETKFSNRINAGLLVNRIFG